MKPAVSVMFLLFLVLLLSANRSQGARVLEEESLAPPHRQVHVSGFSVLRPSTAAFLITSSSLTLLYCMLTPGEREFNERRERETHDQCDGHL
ncbi:hypothetical protein MUK42_34938 [Musa troglodytarum]|uniref:Transmembrane protein n=1 Tax=Musa troglodytarum TaxID=320322 RepID=A0A9E7G7Q5_9LILI|nr:hypothetical protein MUK42_34938 [Musa troglodytarum]